MPEALGLSTKEWVQQRLGGYVKLAQEDRPPVVAELKDDGFSNREIADIIGVDEKTVRNDFAENSAPLLENLHNINDAAPVAAENSAPSTNVRGTQGTGENEWYTPEEYIEAARAVLHRACHHCQAALACAPSPLC